MQNRHSIAWGLIAAVAFVILTMSLLTNPGVVSPEQNYYNAPCVCTR